MYSEIVPTDTSVRINPHSCGTLIADLESMRFSYWQAQPFEEARVKGGLFYVTPLDSYNT